MTKTVLALIVSAALASSAFAASTVVSSFGTPVGTTGQGVVTSASGAAEVTPVKPAPVMHGKKAAKAKPAKSIKKTVHKKTEVKTTTTEPAAQ